MAYRVYDNEKKKWVKDNIYLNPNGELFLIKRFLFGIIKVLHPLDLDRYIYHKDIDLYDKYETLVYEGDFIKAQVDENRAVIGLVAYARELSAYVVLCTDSNEFFTLGTDICKFIEVIGNVFGGYKEDKKDDEQTLWVSKK